MERQHVLTSAIAIMPCISEQQQKQHPVKTRRCVFFMRLIQFFPYLADVERYSLSSSQPRSYISVVELVIN